MLKDVWSVRKDVRVNNAVKASDVGQKSYYSRHGGVSGKFATIRLKLSVILNVIFCDVVVKIDYSKSLHCRLYGVKRFVQLCDHFKFGS